MGFLGSPHPAKPRSNAQGRLGRPWLPGPGPSAGAKRHSVRALLQRVVAPTRFVGTREREDAPGLGGRGCRTVPPGAVSGVGDEGAAPASGGEAGVAPVSQGFARAKAGIAITDMTSATVSTNKMRLTTSYLLLRGAAGCATGSARPLKRPSSMGASLLASTLFPYRRKAYKEAPLSQPP